MLVLAFMLLASLLIFPAYADNRTFGWTGARDSYDSIEDQIVGNFVTCPQTGKIQSITAKILLDTGYSGDVNVAVYDDSFNLLEQATEEALTEATWYWQTWTLQSNLSVTEGETYLIVAWADSVAGNAYLGWHNVAPFYEGYLDSETYSSTFPAGPHAFDTGPEDRKYNIYATYAEDRDYKYTFNGLYDEETGLLEAAGDRAVNVTAYWTDGTAQETFEVNGSRYVTFDSNPYYFHFELGTYNRRYYPTSTEGYSTTSSVYIFNGTLTDYTITFNDWLGVLDSYSWVTASRYINGTTFVVDKKAIDVESKVILNLISDETYIIKLESASASYTYGSIYLTASDTEISLTIKGVTFPQDVILTYRYVRAYGYRSYSNSSYHDITIVYEDTKLNTNYVNVSIYNSTHVEVNGYDYEDADSFSYTWTGAEYNVSYYSVVTINHADYGVLVFKNSYAGQNDVGNVFDFSFLGTLPYGVDTASLIPSIILIALVLMFSPLTAGVGGVVVVLFAALFTLFGWIPIDVNVLVFTGTLAVLYAILKNYKRVTVY